MKKSFLKELVLPAFWLFFFIVSPKSQVKDNKLKKADNTELNKDIPAPGASNVINKNKEATFTKAIYLSGY
ncbi:MAG TPA: hypothetical protein VMY77_01840 [Chitinophagaceae bacterium]|nr:hypothetical protein [Chitinophagaceae bacterium]